MGAMTPAITTLTHGLNTVSGLITAGTGLAGQLGVGGSDPQAAQRRQIRAQQDLALRHLQQQQQGQMSNLQEQTALSREQMAAQAQASESQRLAALRRAMARQRCQFGGSGLSGAESGSAQAVLLGLFDESDEERARREQLDNIRTRALEQNVGQQQSLNILQLNQLRERQRLERELLG